MNKRTTIYTCIAGAYDALRQPSVVCGDIDYYCFVPKGERIDDRIGVWRVVEYDVPSKNTTINSRYPKMMPHLFLKEYEYSLYIDANIDIVSEDFYALLNQKMESASLLSAPSHPVNDCAYDEAELIVASSKDSLYHVLRVLRFLKKERFPRHFGLYENNLIWRRHNDATVIDIDNMWWNLYVKYPKRDQMLLTFCLWKSNVAMDFLLPLGQNVHNSELFSYRDHKPEAGKQKDGFWKRKLMTFPKCIVKICK